MSETANTQQIVERLKSVQVGPRSELEITRHVFHGEATYVVRDPISFRSHQLTDSDYQVFVALDVHEPLQSIFERLCTRQVLTADQQQAFYRFVLELGQLGLLNLPLSDGASLYARYTRRKQQAARNRLWSLLFLRVPLIQPDRFLNATVHLVRPLFTQSALLVWAVGCVLSLFVVRQRWAELGQPVADMLRIDNLPLLWILLVGLKVIHEFGHAYACKVYGGKVPEMGAFLVLFTPCAYVDASASWGFTSRWQRVVVSLGGMYFESIAAIFATAIWSITDPGIIHSAAQYVMLLASIVTIGFNANPLMKYDGYYLLSDLVGMPNLRADAQQQLGACIRRWLLRDRAALKESSSNLRWWVVLFGLVSALYKWFLFFGLIVAIAFRIPLIGLLVAIGYAGKTIGQLGLWLKAQVARETNPASRRRVVACLVVASCALVTAIIGLPVPWQMQAIGVVVREDDHVVRASTAGFLEQALVNEGTFVRRGDPLAILTNRELGVRRALKVAEVRELEIQRQQFESNRLAQVAAIEAEWRRAREELQEIDRQVAELTIRAPLDGQVTDARHLEEKGVYLHTGDALCRVIAGPWTVRALVSAETLADIRPQPGAAVSLRLSQAPREAHHGTIIRVGAAGDRRVEDPRLLATQLTTTRSQKHAEVVEPRFEVTLRCDDRSRSGWRHGSTAMLQFSAARPALGQFLWRRCGRLWNQLMMHYQ